MALEKLVSESSNFGRKLISYAITDPVGETLIISGAYGINKGVPEYISIPLITYGIKHTIDEFLKRKKLSDSINLHGLRKRNLDVFNRYAWCTHRMTIAYVFGQGQYPKFKDFLNQYSLRHYLNQEIKRKKIEAKTILQKIKALCCRI